jgi:hypothetical protein
MENSRMLIIVLMYHLHKTEDLIYLNEVYLP